MPVTVVVGGQFGSEGKGKVAHFLARERKATLAVRVGGPNSGHTVIADDGRPIVFRHLPTACLLPEVTSVIPPGSYLNISVLLDEIGLVKPSAEQLAIDPHAWLITEEDAAAEQRMGLTSRIGSTGSGTGASLMRRLSRTRAPTYAKNVPQLQRYIRDTNPLLSKSIASGKRVLVEGTQGFGLSPLHAGQYPHCTSRDTTAAAFLSESGLSPLDVDEVVLVIRAYPIRVAGPSGPLPDEVTWETVTAEAGSPRPIVEHTSVTQKVRRVGHFDSSVVTRAIEHNRPTIVALNHVDYVDFRCQTGVRLTPKALNFVQGVERQIGMAVNLVGFGPAWLRWKSSSRKRAVSDGY